MKFFRFGEKNQEKPGVLFQSEYYDISSIVDDIDSLFIGNFDLQPFEKYLLSHLNQLPKIDFQNERKAKAITNPSKIVCVGLNFEDHVHETQLEQQAEPILFLKAISSLNGPEDGIKLPKDSKKTDWETELGVVIGKTASYVSEQDAMDYVAGYILVNDVSEREFQTQRGGTWDKGKGCDTFAPIGPFFTTKDEIKDVDNIAIWLKLNGEFMQQGNTSDFIYKIPKLVAYISQFMTLMPGDIISTGSPAGAGMGKKPPIFLKDGDVIEYGIDELGSTTQKVYAYENFPK